MGQAVEKRIEIIVDVHVAGGRGVGFESGVEIGKRRASDFATVDLKRAVGVACPNKNVVFAGDHGEFNRVATDQLALLTVYAADEESGFGVERQEGNAVYFVGKGIGAFHIVVVGKRDEIVALDAVAVLKDGMATGERRHCDRCRGYRADHSSAYFGLKHNPKL